jgi:RimJ/RimL family protein N-acetyltransferase
MDRAVRPFGETGWDDWCEMTTPTLRTARLSLRQWRGEDLAPYAALNADPRVMEHYPQTLSREESDASAARISAALSAERFGLWAVEIPGVCPFIGYVGLAEPRFAAPFTPCVEIGWRLAREHWGRGYAAEAATRLRLRLRTARLEAAGLVHHAGELAFAAGDGDPRHEPRRA